MEIKATDASSKVSKVADVKSDSGKKTRESKKRNKKKHRRGKKKVKLEKKLAAISVVKQKKVLNYLNSWSTREETGDWKFSKSINNWLVKNWSNEGFMDDDQFDIFIEYVGSFKSDCAARRQLVTRANKLLEESSPKDTIYKRCRSLIQTLI